jgi:hypothetical protein
VKAKQTENYEKHNATIDVTAKAKTTKTMTENNDDMITAASATDWMVTLTEPLPNCHSVYDAWERLATITQWYKWRSASPMRGDNVTTVLLGDATEPLQTGDEYIVKVGPMLSIHCHVLESSSLSSSPSQGDDDKSEETIMVLDSVGRALCGLIRARFRFTIFRGKDGIITAQAQEQMHSFAFLLPSKEVLENEHRHTFQELNASFSKSN